MSRFLLWISPRWKFKSGCRHDRNYKSLQNILPFQTAQRIAHQIRRLQLMPLVTDNRAGSFETLALIFAYVCYLRQ